MSGQIVVEFRATVPFLDKPRPRDMEITLGMWREIETIANKAGFSCEVLRVDFIKDHHLVGAPKA